MPRRPPLPRDSEELTLAPTMGQRTVFSREAERASDERDRECLIICESGQWRLRELIDKFSV